jgi:hypothetical protein
MKRILFVACVIGLASPVQAACTCRCENGHLRTICTDPLDASKCGGYCPDSVCLGLCRPHPFVADQSRIQYEAKHYHFRVPVHSGKTLEQSH